MFVSRCEPPRASTEYPPVFLEALEDRIAPANIVVGSVPPGETVQPGTMNYTQAQSNGVTTQFVLAADSPDVDIAGLFVGSTDHYYIDLKARDILQIASPVGPSPLVTINAGRAFVFFHDIDQNGIVSINEITGLSLSAGSNVSVGTGVNGDILTNLNARTGDFSMDLISDTQNIVNLSVNGNVNGSILAGGAIARLGVSSVETIGTGTVGNGYSFDLGGGVLSGAGQGILGNLTLASGKAGANISNVTVDSVDRIEAGQGGAGGRGGSISLVTILADVNGFTVKAGDGGNGALGRAGGAGGTIANVAVKAVPELAPSEQLISILGGTGGLGDGNGAGGAGGAVSSIFVGYDRAGTNAFSKSNVFVTDRVLVAAGDGGNGGNGGLGGAATNINVRAATVGEIIGPVQTLPVQILGGDGGTGLGAAGRGGNGGAVTNYFVINNEVTALDAYSWIEAGDGGNGGGLGGIGGAVTNGVIFSEALAVAGGDGGSGSRGGGNGGALTNLQIADSSSSSLIQNRQVESGLKTLFAEAVEVRAGHGGDALALGRGGNGGTITGITAALTDLDVLVVQAGHGGKAVGTLLTDAGGNGGNGGALTRILFPTDRFGFEVAATINAGNGGDGKRGGGNGGAITAGSQFLLSDATISASAGNGGSSVDSNGDPTTGRGGIGGLVTGLALSATGTFNAGPTSIQLSAGVGGNGGGNGAGGNGGAISASSVRSNGSATVTAGSGGTSGTLLLPGTGAVGAGGAVSTVDVTADFGKAMLTAGSAGTIGGRGAAGGNVLNVAVQGIFGAEVRAGNGALGGFGGDIRTAFAGGTSTSAFLPSGDLIVLAGNGSSGAAAGGRGGSLTAITAYAASGFSNQFAAGNGGDGGTGAGGAGGAINGVTVRGGDAGAVVQIDAGDGGNAAARGAGGLGGSVQNIYSSSANVLIQYVAAGDGGSTAQGTRGANGGSVTNVFVAGDIGVRSGAVYGATTMGGIFAGASGGGPSLTVAGTAGNVINVYAKFIGSIAAGTDAIPQLATRVDRIYLNGFNSLTAEPNGSFTPVEIASSNFVGGILTPSDVDADQFKYTVNNVPTSLTTPQAVWNPATSAPVDGLVAALNIGPNKNVAFNAWLTRQGSDFIIVSSFNQ